MYPIENSFQNIDSNYFSDLPEQQQQQQQQQQQETEPKNSFKSKPITKEDMYVIQNLLEDKEPTNKTQKTESSLIFDKFLSPTPPPKPEPEPPKITTPPSQPPVSKSISLEKLKESTKENFTEHNNNNNNDGKLNPFLKTLKFIFIITFALSLNDIAKFFINSSIKYRGGNHKYFFYYLGGLGILVALFTKLSKN